MVHGYRENGDITTPFDMRVFSELDRFHLAQHAAVTVYGEEASTFSEEMTQQLKEHREYIRKEAS